MCLGGTWVNLTKEVQLNGICYLCWYPVVHIKLVKVVLQETLNISSPSIMTLYLQQTFHNILTFHTSYHILLSREQFQFKNHMELIMKSFPHLTTKWQPRITLTYMYVSLTPRIPNGTMLSIEVSRHMHKIKCRFPH